MSNRFSRQRGLLRQNIVERLDVQFDREHVPTEFSSAMDLLGNILESIKQGRTISSTQSRGIQV